MNRRRAEVDPTTAIIARHRYLLVRVDTIPVAGRRPLVQVDTMRDLVRLAKLHEELIVHAAQAGHHRFALFTDAVVYQFTVATVGPGPVTSVGPVVPTSASPEHDRAKWALAGLEACAAERRRIPGTTPDLDRQLRADADAQLN